MVVREENITIWGLVLAVGILLMKIDYSTDIGLSALFGIAGFTIGYFIRGRLNG